MFELLVYVEDELKRYVVEGEVSKARRKAGSLAKLYDSFVDVAHIDGRDWGDRYITTAEASPLHSSGYRFVRMED